MAITAFTGWSATAASNVDLNSIPLSDSMLANQIDDAFREMMAQLAGAGFVTTTAGVGATLSPTTSDGAALGSTTKMWSDLFLASGAVININNGNVTVTHSAGKLTTNGDLLLSKASPTLTIRKSAAAQFGTLAFENGASSRWLTGVDSTAEGGANAGSNFFINRYDDAGAFLGTPFSITRSSGLISLGSGQIGFPASQNASSDANTLDDYEEGTFTPAFSATSSTFVYAFQTGTYTKIGRMVHFSILLGLTSSGTSLSANTLSITGLPFTSQNTTTMNTVFSVKWASATSSYVNVMASLPNNSTTLSLSGATAAATGLSVVNANALLSTSGQIEINGCYTAAN